MHSPISIWEIPSFFPGQFSLCASLKVMHGAASDMRKVLQGTSLVTRLHPGRSEDIASAFRWGCAPTEGAMTPLVHVLSVAGPAVPLTLAICCCISAWHEPVGANSGWSVLPAARWVAWKTLFCCSHCNSKKMLPPASLCLCLSWLRLYL